MSDMRKVSCIFRIIGAGIVIKSFDLKCSILVPLYLCNGMKSTTLQHTFGERLGLNG